MKKSILIFICLFLIISAILFIPIPGNSYDDGGTKEYKALTYKIVKWNRLYREDLCYNSVRLYFGKEKNKTISELWDEIYPEYNGANSADTISGVIVSGEGTESVLIASETNGLLRLNLNNSEIFIESVQSGWQNLKNGMTVGFSYEFIMETYPGMVSPKKVTAVHSWKSYNDICGLYMNVITELWKEDDGLNSYGENVYLDLSGTPSLNASLKEAIVYLTGNLTGKNVIEATMDQLKEQKIFDDKELYIKDGCYINISGTEESKDKIVFSAQKYVGGTGAIFFNDCIAKWNNKGDWEYNPGSFSIA